MTKKVTVSTGEQVCWPPRCARCGDKGNLTAVGASIGRVTSVRPTLGGELEFTGELTSLQYPMCQEHAKGMGWASFITRKTAGFAFLRVFIGFIGICGFLLVPVTIVRMLSSQPLAGSRMPIEMMAIYLLGSLASIALIVAYQKLPLRLVKKTDDTVTVKFKSDAYAQEFARLNKNIVQRD